VTSVVGRAAKSTAAVGVPHLQTVFMSDEESYGPDTYELRRVDTGSVIVQLTVPAGEAFAWEPGPFVTPVGRLQWWRRTNPGQWQKWGEEFEY
jgi:hypothetical protein